MIYIVKINDKEYEVEVEKGTANILKTTLVTKTAVLTDIPTLPVSSTAFASVPTPSPAPVSKSPIPLGAGESVNAPMPGTIMEIKVTVGMHVKKGDCLVILEAMKMENEIVTPSDGTVKQILAVKGSMVSTGDPLVVIG